MVKYEFALLNGKVIHINEVTSEIRANNKFYSILSDGKEEMVAHLYGKRKKHFQHLKYCYHNNETYLHETAKRIILESYLNCIENGNPYILEYKTQLFCNNHYPKTRISCNLGLEISKFDLTKVFDTVQLEYTVGEFRPDLRLYSNKLDDEIFVEIFVTHKSTEKKINSGKKIIEIRISNEQDLLQLRQSSFRINDLKNTFHNFRIKTKYVDYCSSRERGCRTNKEFYVLFESGIFELNDEYLENILAYLDGHYGEIIEYIIEPFKNKPEFKFKNEKINYLIEHAVNRSLKIKSCSICKYHGYNSKLTSDYYCKFLKKEVGYNDANFCDYFRKE